MNRTILAVCVSAALAALPLSGDDTQSCPDHAKHVAERGDKVMGFSHEKTKHTFRLAADGGSIEVRANATDDAESIAAIRTHLQDVAKDFTAGNFAKPEAIHSRMPDGAAAMNELRRAIAYRYEEIPNGAAVRISTHDPRALEAIHQFLEFQISDHHTGDSGKVE